MNKKRISNKLDSAILKHENIETTESKDQITHLKTLPTNSLDIGIDNIDYGSNEPLDDYNNEFIDYINTDELDKFSEKNKDFKGKTRDSSPESIANLKDSRLIKKVSRANRKSETNLDDIDSDYDSRLNNKKRISKKERSAIRDKKVRPGTLPTRNLRSRKIVITEPIPLTKTKLRQKQKPLLVDMERLIYEEKSDKRHKIHTLDVLKHFIKVFEPGRESGLKLLNEEILHSDFKIHLVNNLDNIMDIIASSNDILSRFTEVQKQKNSLRSKVYEIRKEHSNIGNRLNELRMQYASRRRTCDEYNNIQQELDELNSKLTCLSSNGENVATPSNASYFNMNTLKNLMHSKLGLKNRIKLINDTLQQLNDKL